MFKENDYIVQLHESKSTYLLKNHIYQQNTNSDQLRTNKDSTGRKCNSSYVSYDKPETWRYGTPEEIEEYNRRGEPYDVTTLEPKSLVGRYFKALKKNIQGSCTIEGNYYKIIEDREYCINFYTEKCPRTLLGISKDYLHTIELMPEGFDFNKSEIPMNTYGLKVGDKLPESVIRKWAFIGKNYYTGTWKSNSSVFSGDRKILSFKMLDGIVGFEVSQTADVYLRAEGFKEFMENELIPRFELPEKWYVKATEENEEVLKQWRGGDHLGWDNDLCVSSDRYWELSSYCSKKGFVEITYEQFQKYVLKKDKILTEGNKISLFYKEYPLTPKETFESNELIIPQLKKEKIKINFDLSTSKAVDIQINLSKKQTKQVKQIKIEKFNLSL